MNSNFTSNGYHLPTISRLCKEVGSPRKGYLAEFVWRLSNSAALPVGVAREFLRSAGYAPFKGYPLTNADGEVPLCVAGPQAGSVQAPACSLPTQADIDQFAARARTAIAWTDGGSRGNPGPSAYAVVLNDANGQKITELSSFLGVSTNNVAEYEGLLAALVYARETGYKRLQVYSDSELMVRQIRGIYKVRDTQLSSLFARAIAFIRTFEWFSIDHIGRSHNKEADRLVNQAINSGR
jgi:ribonuclease HI